MELLKSQTIITRHGFCPRCSVNKLPTSGTIFKTVGASGRAHVMECQETPHYYGFTPHIYRLIKVIGKNVVYERVCCVLGCGIVRVPNDQEQCWEYIEVSSRYVRGIMDIKDWNALVMYKKDTDYHMCGKKLDYVT